MSITAIRGFKDILPEQIGWWRRVEQGSRRVLAAFGYQEIRIPLVEKTELFARSIGQDTDIVEKEMYTFGDRNGESLSLRPEATAGVARAVIEHKLAADGRALKLFYTGPMFRYERPQKGRQRQFHQLGVEVYNAAEPLYDAESIALLSALLQAAGLEKVTIKINNLGCPACRPAYRAALQAYLTARKDALCEDCRRRLATNPLRVLDCKSPGCQEAASAAPLVKDTVCQACADHFEAVVAGLDAAGVRYETAPRLVRGLDYYTRTVFEAQTEDLGAQNAVGGGGRYDTLVEALGGPATPAVGFAIGLERLVMLLSEQKGSLPPDGPDLFIAALDQAALSLGFNLACRLRAAGAGVEIEYRLASLKSNLRRAGKLGAKRVLILGQGELETGQAQLKDMADGQQRLVPLDGAFEELKTILGL